MTAVPTSLLPDVDASSPTARLSFPERVAARVSQMLAGARSDRRRFLGRAALVGSALAINPVGFLLRPQTAHATVCGPSNECSQGWSAFCCTINGGANTCPPGSYVAGWWKVSTSSFCRGAPRYIVDCNRRPESSCSCRCAEGSCDRRRVCCNNFRYGQCNQQIPGTTPVVCRIAICTPPWEWDRACTTTVRTDDRTADHSSSCLNGPNPSLIAITYQDLGLVGSALGAPTGAEVEGPDGGSWRAYERGAITYVEAFGVRAVTGAPGQRYAALGGPDGPLGYATAAVEPVGDERGGLVATFEGGRIWWTEAAGAFEVHGPISERYLAEGGPTGWLGYPLDDVEEAPGGREVTRFETGWMLVHDPSTGEVRLFPSDTELPDEPGTWPPTAEVVRWQGGNRIETAARVAQEAFAESAPIAVLARADDPADALVGGVLAGLGEGPVLLVAQDDLPVPTAEELERLAPARVYVLGGTAAVGEEVVEAVEALLPDADVERLSGDDRFATAGAVSREAFPGGEVDQVVVVNARSFADALAAAPAAALGGGPVLLAETGHVPAATRTALERLEPAEVLLLGGTGVLTEDVERFLEELTGAPVERIAGSTRYETAVGVAARTGADADTVLVATGESFADGLAAGPAAILAGAPLLLVARDALPAAVEAEIRRRSPRRIVIVGGALAVSESVADRLAGLPTDDGAAAEARTAAGGARARGLRPPRGGER